MKLPDNIEPLCRAFLDGLNSTLGEKLFGVYLYGALAFSDGGTITDIDFHVIVKDHLDADEKSKLKDIHKMLALDFPALGAELDGYYILLNDARRETPPEHQFLDNVFDNSWALHRAHILAGRCVVLHGPDPKRIYPETSWPELAGALQGELEYVKTHLDKYPAYCVLNLCRLMYSHKTRDVVTSKRSSADWAQGLFQDWRPLISAALDSYAGNASAQDEKLLASEVGKFFGFASEYILEIQGGKSPDRS
jgi:hypothetical protein